MRPMRVGEQCLGVSQLEGSINYLELLAVFLGLKAFSYALSNTHIQLLIDNSTTAAVINHIGTSNSDCLNDLAKEIWGWCKRKDIWLSAAHIARSRNVEADPGAIAVDAFSLTWIEMKF